jgi:predicted kinase
MNKLYLIRGASGAGKSSVVESLVEMAGGTSDIVGGVASLSADDWMVKGGEYEYNKNKQFIVHKICIDQTEKKMKFHCGHIFVHNTFTTSSELRPYYKLAKEYNYDVHSVVVENRHDGKNVHDVSEESLASQKKRFQVKL